MNREEIRLQIKLIAETDIDSGTSKRVHCLICNGGRDREKSLSITRDGNRILYKCFRDSCSLLPGIIINKGGIPRELIPKPHSERSYDRETGTLSAQDVEFFGTKFGLDKDDLFGVYKTFEDPPRYLLPMYGPMFEMRGQICRSFYSKPKAITYRLKADQPFIGWFTCPDLVDTTPGTVVVVEDWFSAAKIAKAGHLAVCLNGTHISWGIAVELGEFADNIILALDKGALSTAMKHYKLYSGLWKDTRVLSLERDLKYEEEETIRNAVTNRETTSVGSPERPPGLRGALQ